jgi:hypothetical protein
MKTQAFDSVSSCQWVAGVAMAFAITLMASPSLAEDRTQNVVATSVRAPVLQSQTAQQSLRKLSAAELDSVIAKHRAVLASTSSSQLEEVVVTRPAELLPVHSQTRDVWPGIAAPFWAIMHPTQAWRILMPIPSD